MELSKNSGKQIKPKIIENEDELKISSIESLENLPEVQEKLFPSIFRSYSDGIIEEIKHTLVNESDQSIESVLDKIKSKRPLKKFSKIILKDENLLKPIPIKVSGLESDKIKTNPKLVMSFQEYTKMKKTSKQIRSYKEFFVTLLETILFRKVMEPALQCEIDIRMLSIPKPETISCNYKIII